MQKYNENELIVITDHITEVSERIEITDKMMFSTVVVTVCMILFGILITTLLIINWLKLTTRWMNSRVLGRFLHVKITSTKKEIING